MKGNKIMVENVSLDSTVQELYDRVDEIEDTPSGKWKLMVVAGSARTLKPSDGDKLLKEYGLKADQTYRLEVILDMGACHTTCRR
jgi:hypothetical protein